MNSFLHSNDYVNAETYSFLNVSFGLIETMSVRYFNSSKIRQNTYGTSFKYLGPTTVENNYFVIF